jgi:hypothetical protein
MQRICQYPVQLIDLLKSTSLNHNDYDYVQQACQFMRELTISINEQKRRMESIESIHRWQQTIDDWHVRIYFSMLIVVEFDCFVGR